MPPQSVAALLLELHATGKAAILHIETPWNLARIHVQQQLLVDVEGVPALLVDLLGRLLPGTVLSGRLADDILSCALAGVPAHEILSEAEADVARFLAASVRGDRACWLTPPDRPGRREVLLARPVLELFWQGCRRHRPADQIVLDVSGDLDRPLHVRARNHRVLSRLDPEIPVELARLRRHGTLRSVVQELRGLRIGGLRLFWQRFDLLLQAGLVHLEGARACEPGPLPGTVLRHRRAELLGALEALSSLDGSLSMGPAAQELDESFWAPDPIASPRE